ncbi:MAG: DUF885 domain-containing protein [Cytophagales bacterium]|nr:DUF885 domain-containing protein [Cytophagales bacterium]
MEDRYSTGQVFVTSRDETSINKEVKKPLTILIFLIQVLSGTAQTIDDLRDQWEESWPELKIPTLQLAYQNFLNQHLEAKTLKEQNTFFQSMASQLDKIDLNVIGRKDRLDWKIMNYETSLNLQRLQLIKATQGHFQEGGVFHGPNGKRWYTYLIKHWTSTDITPEEVTAYGWSEVKRVKSAMKKLQAENDINRAYTDEEQDVEQAFSDYEQFLEKQVWSIVPHWFMPDLKIRRGSNANLKQVPGYYGGNVLSYNLFDDPFDLSQIDWLYLHEGIPGHHFQINSESRADIPGYRSRISYSGYREGWAAYVEELAQEQGWYTGPAQRFSQMEWDLIRSTRLILDVGLNYEGWTDEKAMEVWQSIISDADHIGKREIARMRRWPAQVLTYKIGTKTILDTRAKALGGDNSNKALRAFHSKLLSKGSIPMALVPQLFGLPR